MRNNTAALIALTVVIVLLVLVGGGIAYMYSGAYNVAATDDHLGVVRWVLSTTTERSILEHAEEVPPLDLPSDSTTLRRGYRAYDAMCVMCHGAPGVERGWAGKGMKPQPPEMHHVAEEMSPEQVYWVLAHGIKFAGMPALQPTHSAEEIAEITAFVTLMEDMTPEEYAAWGSAAGASGEAPESQGAGHSHDDDGHEGHSH